MSILRIILFVLLALLSSARATAQVDGAATTILIPIVAATASFTSEIYIKDQSGTSRTVSMQFYEAIGSQTPGPKTCAAVQLAAFQTLTITIAGQCGPLAAGGHFGFVVLTDASPNKDKLFYAFSRVSNPQGIGFSAEGYPLGHIGGGETYSEVPGVKRKAATGSIPAFQTNCFVAALDDPVDYSITVDDASGSSTLSDTLLPFQMRRYLDIYTATGATAGDHDNSTVTFQKITPEQFPNTLLAFCTVQDNTSFGADFRISKNWNEADPARFRLNCFAAIYGANPGECTSTLQPSAPSVPNATTKIRLITRLYAPDTVNCSIISSRSSDLEMRLVRDSDNTVVAGGENQAAFTYTTGPRSTIGAGYHQYHWLEVGFRDGGNPTFPIPFGIRCMSGNGMMDPLPVQSVPDDF
ncbi:MAG: hypothetical protein ACHP7B_02680 [Burkholderiales bacterium]|jgi:hypothetical protein